MYVACVLIMTTKQGRGSQDEIYDTVLSPNINQLLEDLPYCTRTSIAKHDNTL